MIVDHEDFPGRRQAGPDDPESPARLEMIDSLTRAAENHSQGRLAGRTLDLPFTASRDQEDLGERAVEHARHVQQVYWKALKKAP